LTTYAPEYLTIPIEGGDVHALAWGDEKQPLLLFSHATGMCAELYTDLLAPLGSRFRVVAPDARGHGRTTLPWVAGDVPVDWMLYRRDLRALARALAADGEPVLLAGHSFGATVAFETAVETPGLARAVLLFEPAFIPFAHADGFRALRDSGGDAPNVMAERAARRRGIFPSLQAVREAYHQRGVFADWSDAALDAYLEGGTLPCPEGVRLACDPAWEATSFRGVSTTLEASFSACTLPFALVYGTVGSTVPPDDAAAIAAMHPEMMVQQVEGAGHFLPVTHAELARGVFLRL